MIAARVFRTAATALMLLWMLPVAPASAAAPVAISGRVVNGTKAAAVPLSLQVTAAQVTSAGNQTQRLTATAGPDGSFRIEGFSGEGSHFLVATTYQGVTYSTVKDADGSSELSVELKIFETTTDESVVSVVSDSVTVIQGKDDVFEVLQLMRIRNASDRTFIGTPEEDAAGVVELPVAVGGFDVAAGEGITPNQVRPSSVGIIANDPLQPGETDFSYSYKLRVPRTGLAFGRPVAYPTDHIDLLAGPGLDLRSPDVRFVEDKQFGGKRFRRFRSSAMEPGNVIEADISHATGASSTLWLGLGSLLAFLLAVALMGAARHRRRRVQQVEATPATRQQLIEAIARLDDRFARGGLDEDSYRKQRKVLKDELVVLSEQLVP